MERIIRLLPGLALVAVLVAVGIGLNSVIPQVSILIFAIALGVALAPLAGRLPAAAPGIEFAARPLLRAGVALLGLQISLHAVSGLGLRGVAVAVGVVVITMLATIVLGRLLGVDPSLAILIATGSAICGASAIAAMQGVARADEDRVGYAIGTVTLFGSIAMLTLPYVFVPLFGMSDRLGGLWAGASIHEVAQVAAAGAAISPAALKIAALMKLTRVVLLAPTVALAASLRGADGTVSAPIASRPGLRARIPRARHGPHGGGCPADHPQHRPLGRDLPARRGARGARPAHDATPRSAPPAGARCCWASVPGWSRCWCRSACWWRCRSGEGVARPGFEPGTPRFSVECSTGLSYPANAFQGYRTPAFVRRRTRTRPSRRPTR